MTDVEIRMTKEARSTNVEAMSGNLAGRLRHSDFVIHSSFGFRHSSFALLRLLAPDRNLSAWGGTEAVGLRPYVPGDDYRQVDWRLCARRDELFTRTYDGGGDVPCYFLLDCSASMGLGSPSKFDAARRLAAALGAAALAAGNAIDISPFSGRMLPGGLRLRGKNQVLRLLRFLDTLALDASPTDLGRAAAALAGRYQQPGPVLILSDLLDRGGFRSPLERLRRRGYSPRIVQVYAAEEADPRALGDVELRDMESPHAVRVTLSPRIVARYRELFAQFMTSVRQYAVRRGLQCVQLASDESLPATFAQTLARSGKSGGSAP
jgi:uncharacterized protein (DUF58 family)